MSKSSLSLSLSLSLGSLLGKLLAPLALAGAVALPAYAESPFLVPHYVAEKPIKDDVGRTRVIIDFIDDAHVNSPKDPPPGWDARSVHQPQVANFVNAHAKRYGYTPSGMTTWVGTSATAYLSDVQIKRLRVDKDVAALHDDQLGQFSSLAPNPPPPWNNQSNGSEVESWGRVAVNGVTKTQGSRTVYIIDGGVALHDDLPSVSNRVNAACGSGGTCHLTDPTHYPEVGCYAHPTHVAGIIGAVSQNMKTTAGVYAGVNMESIAITTAIGSTLGQCGDSQGIAWSAMGYALDYVYSRIDATHQMGIVNISMNSFGMGWNLATMTPEANYSKIRQLATRALKKGGGIYPGAFVVQSAGNGYDAINAPTLNTNVCTGHPISSASVAYRPYPYAFPNTSDPDDGIMVVGALQRDGRPIKPSLLFSATTPTLPVGQGALSGVPPPSNYGGCVDIWAPGDDILSTWGLHINSNTGSIQTKVGVTYSGNYPLFGGGWAGLSGTSMAAPHVAAIGAYLADRDGLTTPTQVENAIRALGRELGPLWDTTFNDQSGLRPKMAQL